LVDAVADLEVLRTGAQDGKGFIMAIITTVTNFFGRKPVEATPERRADRPDQAPAPHEIARREEVLSRSTFYKHWNAIKAEGISASQFIEFLQPLADLDGISVSFVYKDDHGKEQIYNHRRDDPTYANPLSRAIQEKKLSKEKALSFALNEQGRVWIESNFMDPKDLK
jgi:hypothetical protein